MTATSISRQWAMDSASHCGSVRGAEGRTSGVRMGTEGRMDSERWMRGAATEAVTDYCGWRAT